MCLVAVAWQAHPRYPFLLLGNRDEFHRRATAPAGWWADAPDVFGGRDLRAGGSWLGVSKEGRVAVVTNNPLKPPTPTHRRSRGDLVREWLAGTRTTDNYLNGIEMSLGEYAGFSLLVGSVQTGMAGLVTPAGALGARWAVPVGVHVVSNSSREAPWPKDLWLQQAVERYFARLGPAAQLNTDELLALLERRMPVADPDSADLPARVRVTPFIAGDDYGTRAATLIVWDADGAGQCIERRFGPGGVATGESRARWRV